MQTYLATELRQKRTRAPIPFHGRWITSNWSFNFVRNPSLGQCRRKSCQPSPGLPDGDAHHDEFTLAEHLQVQQKIEKRAYELWQAAGSHPDTSLTHWSQAEDEIIHEHCLNRPQL